MENFKYTDLVLVSEMAAGMTKEEILETFFMKEDDLSKDEKIAFAEFYAWGRGMAVHQQVQRLLEQSKGRNGTAATMAFLRRFSKEFEAELDGDGSGSFSFTFGSVEKQ